SCIYSYSFKTTIVCCLGLFLEFSLFDPILECLTTSRLGRRRKYRKRGTVRMSNFIGLFSFDHYLSSSLMSRSKYHCALLASLLGEFLWFIRHRYFILLPLQNPLNSSGVSAAC